MSLTVIQYADTVRLAVMTDARLSPAHAAPARRWPAAVQQLVARVDHEIAKLAAHGRLPTPPRIITPPEPPEPMEEAAESETQSTSALRPPSPTIASPPPVRRRVTHH